MSLPVVVRPEAQQDLTDAEAWYERQRSGLGQDFLAEVSVQFDDIAAQPQLYAVAWKNVRACRLRRFPYVVYYRAWDDRVEVLAVLHGSRDPAVWQSRA
jgi:plasmid stabilization system protein ParE